ncbi:hypothetical protein [Kribbella sp. NPDC051718]|uniref:hypothetical protein n=1 Tax=Kribbella sp. NPDC051718 TaxID=3155168 RepID=UPI00343946D4
MGGNGQRRLRGVSAVLSLILLAGLGATSAAGAATEGSATPAVACSLSLGSGGARGEHSRQEIRATVPPSITPTWTTEHVYTAGGPWMSSRFQYEPGPAGGGHADGWVAVGDGLYRSQYNTDENQQLVGRPIYRRVGGGWGMFRAFEESQYVDASFDRTNEYALRNQDGTLFRWTVDAKGGWHKAGTAAGFSAVKAMALISKTRTYDTFLANTHSGGLYTIHIPTKLPMKPVVKVVRKSTWQGFDTLIAQGCGNGVLLLGINRDTEVAYLYAVGHANGTATPIQNRGKLPATLTPSTYFRWGYIPDLDRFGGE